MGGGLGPHPTHSPSGAELLSEALGTPYRHQTPLPGRKKGYGMFPQSYSTSDQPTSQRFQQQHRRNATFFGSNRILTGM